MEDSVVFFIWLWGHESCFMFVGVEFFVDGVQVGQVVFGEGLYEDGFGYFQVFVEVCEFLEVFVFFFDGQFFLRDGVEGVVEVVDGFDEVFCEGGDGEFMGLFDFVLCVVLEVVEVGDGVKVFVLQGCL